MQYIFVPIIHIADATAEVIGMTSLLKAGLLGTRFTMTDTFFTERLKLHYNIECIIPRIKDIDVLHRCIIDELTKGIFLPKTKEKILDIMYEVKARGAEGIIIACTELPLLISQADFELQLFDTIKLHCIKAFDFILG